MFEYSLKKLFVKFCYLVFSLLLDFYLNYISFQKLLKQFVDDNSSKSRNRSKNRNKSLNKNLEIYRNVFI